MRNNERRLLTSHEYRIPAAVVAIVLLASGRLSAATETGASGHLTRSLPGLEIVDFDGARVIGNPTVVPMIPETSTPTAEKRLRTGPTPRNHFIMTGPDDFTFRSAPGDSFIIKLDAGQAAPEISVTGTAGYLTAGAMAAVSAAPPWIRDKLAANLAMTDPTTQDRLVAPLLDAATASWHDEIAFLLASIPAANLGRDSFDPRSLVDQPRFAALADADLDYVELIDCADPHMAPCTTARYRWIEGGIEKTFDLDPADYYWWVIHPILDMEEFEDSNPATGKPDVYPAGLSWREYYLHDRPWPSNTGDPASYIPHYIFKTASAIEALPGFDAVDPGSLKAWGPVQRGYIREIDVGTTHLTVDSADRPTTVEFKVRRTGIVLATTLEVERAWVEGRSTLLSNMLRYGAGNAGLGKWAGRVLVVKDRATVESDPDVVENVLDQFQYRYDVVAPSWLASGDLSPYVKIVVPSDQSVAVYQALADNSAKLGEWLRGKWRILEIHAAVSDPSRDWSGIPMPGGFTVEGLFDETAPEDDFARVLGQPWLNPAADGNPDLPRTIDVLWDDAVRDIRGGDRFPSDTSCAVDRVTWWAGQNMPDSVTDWSEKHPGVIVERTSQANRVLYQHFGNCGELQDIQTAAFRTMLIPTANTSNGAEDHVWSEFLVDGRWHPTGLDWSDGFVNIDNPNVSMSKKFGGGKNISFVTSYRGDGALINRTSTYAETGSFTVHVRDSEGNPVVGAIVLVATEQWGLSGDSYPLMLAFWDVTGSDGDVTVETGANIQQDPATECADLNNRCNNYYIKVVADIGTFPTGEGEIALAVGAAEAVPGYSKELTATLDAAIQTTEPEIYTRMWSGAEQSTVSLTVETPVRLRCGRLGSGFEWCDPSFETASSPAGRLMILNQENYDLWIAGRPFAATINIVVSAAETPRQTIETPGWPSEGTWYLVFEQTGPLQDRMLVRGRIEYLTASIADPADLADWAENDSLDSGSQTDSNVDCSDQGKDVAGDAPDSGDQGTDETGGGYGDKGCSSITGAGYGLSGSPLPCLVVLLLVCCVFFVVAGRNRHKTVTSRPQVSGRRH